MRNLTFCASDSLIAEIDHAVKRARHANPDSNLSRSAFIKTAIRREIDDLNARSVPKVRVRHRPISVNPGSL